MSDRIEAIKKASRRLLSAKIIVLGGLAAGSYALYQHPPFETIQRREVGVRLNRLTGSTTQVKEGMALVIPGIHDLRRYSLQDQLYRPERSSKADGEAPFQSSEGLSLGVELTIRYALDPDKLATVANKLPTDLGGELVEPLVQGVIYKVFTRYTVREIFSTKRQELQDVIEGELKPLLANDGVILRSVMMGNVDLPPDYRAGMDKLLAVELQTEQMAYTLQLKEKQVKEAELQADADKVRREKAAEATANEQIIAAKAQEEAMKHVLPFKEKQIEQRKLEAEAEKASRIKSAEGTAEARRIEAAGEADSRRKLADAETYRLDQIGKVNSTQLERDGELISKHPLLIQKTLADKLSDKISVIIAPPPASGGFIGTALVGATQQRGAKTTVASAAFLKAAPANSIGAEPFDALGTLAERLARRASTNKNKANEAQIAAHLEVVASYGVAIRSFEHDGHMTLCYDGEAFRRVLALKSTDEEKARAALALTREDCVDPNLTPLDLANFDQWRADVLERVPRTNLPEYTKNRLRMRNASVWSSIAFARTRKGEPAQEAAQLAIAELAAVNKNELADEDQAAYNDAAMRVGASRWAAEPALANPPPGLAIVTAPGQPGETCIKLLDKKRDTAHPLLQRCTFGAVWANSARANAYSTALTLAVQPLAAWRELWVFHLTDDGWRIDTLSPANDGPDIGYIEFAGWVPGAKRLLAARESRVAGKFVRSFDVLDLDTLAVQKHADNPEALSLFYRWQDPAWKRQTVSLR